VVEPVDRDPGQQLGDDVGDELIDNEGSCLPDEPAG